MIKRIYSILFICHDNACLSIMAQSVLRAEGPASCSAFSAGVEPSGVVSPLALRLLAESQYPLDGSRTKSWDEFASASAPQLDFVFSLRGPTLFDSHPVWPGPPRLVDWTLDDPASMADEADAEICARRALRELTASIRRLVDLSQDDFFAVSSLRKLQDIGPRGSGS